MSGENQTHYKKFGKIPEVTTVQSNASVQPVQPSLVIVLQS